MNKLVAVAQLAVCFVLLLCISGSGQNRPAELVGHWISDEDEEEYSPFSFSVGGRGSLTVYEMELFSDGTAIFSKSSSDNSAGTWKVVDKRFVASVTVLGSPIGLALNYKLSGYELVVIDGDGDSSKYIRKENLKEYETKVSAEKAKKNAIIKIYNKAEAAFGKDDWDGTISFASETIRLLQNDPVYNKSIKKSAYELRALAYYYKKDYDSALEEINQMLIISPSASDYLLRASVWGDKKNYDNAFADYSEAIRLNPKYAEAYSERGWFLATRGDYEKAIADCNIAINLKPNYAYAYDTRGFAYAGKKDYDKAISDYTKALQLDPKLEGSYLRRGNAYDEKGEYKKAADDFTKFLQMSKDIEEIKEAKAGLERVQKVTTNIEKYNNAIKNAENARQKNDFDGVISYLSSAIQIYPDKVGAYGYKYRGLAYFMKKDAGKAITDLSKALEYDPNDSDLYLYRALAWSTKENYDKAIEDINKAIEMKPNKSIFYGTRGSWLAKKGDYDRAIADCNRAINLQPDFAIAYDSRGFAYAGKKDYDKAISDYTAALKLEPKQASPYLGRGNAYNEKGEYQKAISDFNAVLKISKDSEEIEKAKAGLERAKKGSGK